MVCFLSTSTVFSAHNVGGYINSKGTYVAPHISADRNTVRWDNPSSKSQGGKNRDEFSTPPATNKSNSTWGTSDNDNDGVPNSIDRYPNSKKNGF